MENKKCNRCQVTKELIKFKVKLNGEVAKMCKSCNAKNRAKYRTEEVNDEVVRKCEKCKLKKSIDNFAESANECNSCHREIQEPTKRCLKCRKDYEIVMFANDLTGVEAYKEMKTCYFCRCESKLWRAHVAGLTGRITLMKRQIDKLDPENKAQMLKINIKKRYIKTFNKYIKQLYQKHN